MFCVRQEKYPAIPELEIDSSFALNGQIYIHSVDSVNDATFLYSIDTKTFTIKHVPLFYDVQPQDDPTIVHNNIAYAYSLGGRMVKSSVEADGFHWTPLQTTGDQPPSQYFPAFKIVRGNFQHTVEARAGKVEVFNGKLHVIEGEEKSGRGSHIMLDLVTMQWNICYVKDNRPYIPEHPYCNYFAMSDELFKVGSTHSWQGLCVYRYDELANDWIKNMSDGSNKLIYIWKKSTILIYRSEHFYNRTKEYSSKFEKFSERKKSEVDINYAQVYYNYTELFPSKCVKDTRDGDFKIIGYFFECDTAVFWTGNATTEPSHHFTGIPTYMANDTSEDRRSERRGVLGGRRTFVVAYP